jgi:sigma-54 dependent transcriptional regulator, acetoin dehydrogenase operon transcriptional activator AcoR
MNGAKDPTNGASPATSGAALGDQSLEVTAAARERFAAGADTVQGVRPEILMSWYRCREDYGVDPRLDRAPAAAELSAHSIKNDVVFAELGGLATAAAAEVDGLDGIVAVADPDGRILASWGNQRVLRLAEDSNLAPWYTWSEWASGTNGMGTALESHGPVMVRGPEHWCRGFHPWTCAGVAVRDVVTHDPLAVLDISCWKTSLPDTALPWLRNAAAATEAKLRRQAHHDGTLLAAAVADARVAPATPLAAVDAAGNVVLADDEAAVLLGVPADTPAYAPARRRTSDLTVLPRLVSWAIKRAQQDPHWSGSAYVFVPFLDASISVAVRPVFNGTQVIGALLAFGVPGADRGFRVSSGDPVLGSPSPRPIPGRVIALREDRWVVLDPGEIRFVEADRNNIWLTSDRGRLLAATRGLDRLEQQLSDHGFLRVHRRFLVNVGRIREIEQGFKGTLFLVTQTRTHEIVPVARRHIPDLRQALGVSFRLPK